MHNPGKGADRAKDPGCITRPTQQEYPTAIDLAVDMATEERVIGKVVIVAVLVDLIWLIIYLN